MNGFREDLMSKILGVNSHLLVLSYEGAFKDYDKVISQWTRLRGRGINPVSLQPGYGEQLRKRLRVILRGIDTETAPRVIGIGPMIKEGSLQSLDRLHEGLPAII